MNLQTITFTKAARNFHNGIAPGITESYPGEAIETLDRILATANLVNEYNSQGDEETSILLLQYWRENMEANTRMTSSVLASCFKSKNNFVRYGNVVDLGSGKYDAWKHLAESVYRATSEPFSHVVVVHDGVNDFSSILPRSIAAEYAANNTLLCALHSPPRAAYKKDLIAVLQRSECVLL